MAAGMPGHVQSENTTTTKGKLFLFFLLTPLKTTGLCSSLFHHIKLSFIHICSLAQLLLHAGNTILTGDPSGLRLHQDHNKLVGPLKKLFTGLN